MITELPEVYERSLHKDGFKWKCAWDLTGIQNLLAQRKFLGTVICSTAILW